MFLRIREQGYLYVGGALLLIFWLQTTLDFEWGWIEAAQNNEIYKQCTGFLLFALLLHQWYLSLRRAKKPLAPDWPYKTLHQWLGALAPALFYLHAVAFGRGYLFFLSLVYFANLMIGLANDEALGFKKRWFKNCWLVLHVTLSVITIALVLYHIYIVYEYE